jgi:hypothetical protein
MPVHDPKSCSLCGARVARAGAEAFLRSLSESNQKLDEHVRRTNAAALQRARERVRTLESQAEHRGHDDLMDRRTEAERVMRQAEEQASREIAGRPRRDNSKQAIEIFRENARTRKGAGEFGQ